MTYEDFKAAWKTAYAEAEKNDPENPIPYVVHRMMLQLHESTADVVMELHGRVDEATTKLESALQSLQAPPTGASGASGAK